jgi:hypothetical protein
VRLLVVEEFPLRNGPGVIVLACPEGSTHVHQLHQRAGLFHLVEQGAGTSFHDVFLPTPRSPVERRTQRATMPP